MNYFTLKKTAALSAVSLMAVVAVQAQDTTKPIAKIFGGGEQYNTWSIGLNAGATSTTLATGGSTDFNGNVVNLGYGISLKKQLAHSFALQADLHGGKVEGDAGKAGVVIDGVTGNKYVNFQLHSGMEA